MRNQIRIPLVGLGALVLALAAPGIAMAQTTGTTYQANLQPVSQNTPPGAASGHVTVTMNGNQATIHETVSGLATTLPTSTATLKTLNIPASFAGKPFPHVQHIHGLDQGTCPTASADSNHDGVISTTEAQPDYGAIQTTLSETGSTAPSAGADVTIAPGGGSYTYNRTITLSSSTMKALQDNTAVVVVHGLNPATAPKASLTTPDDLHTVLHGESQPVKLIATAPALCGKLMSMPSGAPSTGAGSTSGLQHDGLFGLGGALVLGGLSFGAAAYRRRRSNA